MGRSRLNPATRIAKRTQGRLWTPATATAGGFRPALWQRADGSVDVVGTAVTAWNDESGNLRHATQATAGFRPTLIANAINGKPAVRFDGTDDRLVLANARDLARNVGGFAMIVVRKPTVTESRPMTILTFWLPGPALHIVLVVTATNQDGVAARRIAANAATSLIAAGTINITNYQIHVGSINFSAGTMAYYINGASVGSSALVSSGLTADVASGNDPRIGALPSDLEFWEGDIAEVIVYNTTALSTADRRQVESYLSQKYGIAVV